MNDIDKKIQAALRRHDHNHAFTDDPNLAEEVIAAFRGRHRWLSALMVILNLVFFAGAIWAAVGFYHADSVPEQLRWGALAAVLIAIVMFMKLWFWLEMHSNRVLREVKRVELLLVARETNG